MSVTDQNTPAAVASTRTGATREQVLESATRAQGAAAELALLSRAVKDRALLAMANALLDRRAEILTANDLDVAAAQVAGTPDSLVDRLRLNTSRVDGMAAGLRELAGLPDPVGTIRCGCRSGSSRSSTRRGRT